MKYLILTVFVGAAISALGVSAQAHDVDIPPRADIESQRGADEFVTGDARADVPGNYDSWSFDDDGAVEPRGERFGMPLASPDSLEGTDDPGEGGRDTAERGDDGDANGEAFDGTYDDGSWPMDVVARDVGGKSAA